MNPIDQELYRLFSPNYYKHIMGQIEGKTPQLHDVFRVGEDREIKLGIHNTSEYLYSLHVRTNDRAYYLRSYNPTLPLLQQSDATKQSIIDLFS